MTRRSKRSSRSPDGAERNPESEGGIPASVEGAARPGLRIAPSGRRGSTKARKGSPSAEATLGELRGRLLEISDLSASAAVLAWDQATYMPVGGAEARGRQCSLISRLVHERMTDPGLGRLLDRLMAYGESLPHDSDEARLISVTRRDFERAVKVPATFVERASALGSSSYDAWRRARPNNDFAAMRPYLEKILDLRRDYVEFFAPYQHVLDPLIDEMDEGMTCASVQSLFGELRRELSPIVRSIGDQAPADDSCLHGAFAEGPQLEFGLGVARAFGYDLERGRLDRTPHPFCTKFSAGDVRITTRVYPGEVTQALFSTLHEAGHALYEQGVAPELAGTPLGWGASAGVHESQSRLWENVVGRSLGFWRHFYPKLRAAFPDRLGKVPLKTFHRAINKVERSPIRTDADEVTYNLHIMLRFDLELELIEGRLAAKDLPEAWRRRTCRRPGGHAANPTSASALPTTATAACRTCIGIRAASAARSRAIRSAMC